MKRLLILFIFLLPLTLQAQDLKPMTLPDGLTVQPYSNEYLDTLNMKKVLSINDYSMIGISYGMNLSRVLWNPTRKQNMLLMPYNIGITYTKYGKMFGYMPFFGFQIGVNYTQEGYEFEYNEEKNYTFQIEGAEKAVYDIIEVPMYMHGHYDFWNFKLMVNLGCYAGYRLNIQRFPGKTGYVTPELEYSFTDYERRLDYGVKGGVGFGLVFDPFEIHFQATYKHSFSTLFEPDYMSEYYYRYGYPSNIVISAGLHMHLSKRSGKSKSDLKKEAKRMVFGR